MRDELDLTIVYVQTNDKVRLIRQLNREEEPDVDEILRRYRTDQWDFIDFDEWIESVIGKENILYIDNNGAS